MVTVVAPPDGVTRNYLGCNTLVLDPATEPRRQMVSALKDMGCTSVQECGHSAEALTALRLGGLHLMFVDWSEATDAPTLLHSIRAEDGDSRFVPVVVMTAFRHWDSLKPARDAGANDFLLRPFPPEAVVSRLNTVLGQPRLFIATGTYFGPDRRRRHAAWRLPERRVHENWRGANRRVASQSGHQPERRQGYPGFVPLERRNAPRA